MQYGSTESDLKDSQIGLYDAMYQSNGKTSAKYQDDMLTCRSCSIMSHIMQFYVHVACTSLNG